jgi:hypothetical protein
VSRRTREDRKKDVANVREPNTLRMLWCSALADCTVSCQLIVASVLESPVCSFPSLCFRSIMNAWRSSMTVL